MKTLYQTRRVIGALVIVISLGACNDFISPTDVNPNAVPEAELNQLFTAIQVNTFLFSEGHLSRVSAIWTQQMAGTDRQFALLDGYVTTEEEAEWEWSAMYTGGGLVDMRRAIAAADEADRQVYAGILRIHEAYMFGMAASIFGDLPYSEAANFDIEHPKLDPQADVYGAIQSLLDQAISDLAAGGSGPGSVDLAFGGDAAKWRAVAYTLKARLHLHWAEASGNSAYTAALAAAQNGIQSANGTWKATHTSAGTEANPWYQFMRDRSGYISSGDYLVPLMVADADPRLPWYFSEASPGVYQARASELSPTGYGAAAFDFPMVSCSENGFIMAEAHYNLGDQGAARNAAKSALACQEAQWGVDLTAQKNAMDGLTGAALLRGIMTQKYTALFLNIESWNDYKRTCLPAISERPGGMPGRLFYGQQERQTNPNIPAPAQQPLRNANDPGGCS